METVQAPTKQSFGVLGSVWAFIFLTCGDFAGVKIYVGSKQIKIMPPEDYAMIHILSYSARRVKIHTMGDIRWREERKLIKDDDDDDNELMMMV
ncbi:hypothetical protein DM860_011635 [Cuscuta australis]|uniref:Uncharacterized protein n=1 Tax=Cuscuta australis TaxID=267555 RepID=A0A328DIA0_9ASTE|nr:hypothetical protein DM860_011635 [Cuscuta australis]